MYNFKNTKKETVTICKTQNESIYKQYGIQLFVGQEIDLMEIGTVVTERNSYYLVDDENVTVNGIPVGYARKDATIYLVCLLAPGFIGLFAKGAQKEEKKEEVNEGGKIKFNGTAVVGKVRKGETAPETEGGESNFYNFVLWEKGNKKRIYINDYNKRSVGYIDLNNDNAIEVNFSQDSDPYRTAKWFVENYEF